MLAHPKSITSKIHQTLWMAMTAFALTLLTTTASASCFDRTQGVGPSLPKGFMAQLAESPNVSNPTIAGLWHATYTTSDNQVFQESFDMWHNDGTEMESANVNPVIGNFCMGVWKQVGSQIHLHHVGWGFDNLGNLVGPFTVDDVLALGKGGNTYGGSFDFKLYDTEGNLVQEVTGTIAATRIGVN